MDIYLFLIISRDGLARATPVEKFIDNGQIGKSEIIIMYDII